MQGRRGHPRVGVETVSGLGLPPSPAAWGIESVGRSRVSTKIAPERLLRRRSGRSVAAETRAAQTVWAKVIDSVLKMHPVLP